MRDLLTGDRNPRPEERELAALKRSIVAQNTENWQKFEEMEDNFAQLEDRLNFRLRQRSFATDGKAKVDKDSTNKLKYQESHAGKGVRKVKPDSTNTDEEKGTT